MRKKYIVCVLAAALLLSGCAMQGVNQMYQLPKRSEDYSNLHSVINAAMADLEFCAPLSGENQQTVQMADLNGDGEEEYLVFTKGNFDLPLRILVFSRVDEGFAHCDTIDSSGASFDQVEYVQMDEKPGLEMVVGRQLSDQLVRSVSVYTFSSGKAEKLVSANYKKFITADFNDDSKSELLVLRPNTGETDNGIAELYNLKGGIIEKSNEAGMSSPVENLKRVVVGKLQDGQTALFVASTVGNNSLVSDVFTIKDKILVNLSHADGSGTGLQTLRNYFIYADDIDKDGILELPKLVTVVSLEETAFTKNCDMICWYAMQSDGKMIEKLYTYYVSASGWFVQFNESLAKHITARCMGNTHEFYLWNEDYTVATKLFTVYALVGQNREEQSTLDDRFVLLKTDTVIYAASLESAASDYFITQQSLIHNFNLIQREWNTGET